jgi:hypothetical protein
VLRGKGLGALSVGGVGVEAAAESVQGIRLVEKEEPGGVNGFVCGQLGDGDQTGRLGVLEHISQTFSGIVGIQWQVGSAGFKHGQDTNDHLDRAWQC